MVILSHIKRFIKETDIILLLICIATSVFGVLMVHSATYQDISEGSVLSRDTQTMILAVTVGIIAAVVISAIDYEAFLRLWPVVAIVSIALMVLLFFVGVGPESRSDVKTWLVLGNTGLYFQPSELVKLGFIITFTAHLDKLGEKANKFGHFVLLCVHAAIPIVLVYLTGDLGSALVFIFVFVVMIFTAGIYIRYFVLGAAVLGGLTPIAWLYVLSDTQKERILALFYPEEYEDIIYQQEQGLAALKNGGLWGTGYLQGTYTQNGLVPESENDMIFTVVGEELGFAGCVLLLLLLFMIVAKITRNGIKAKNNAASLICYGTAAMIASQVIVNVGMCFEIFPVIGITLPFISAGGSSNLCIYLGIGLILSVYRYEKKNKNVQFNQINIQNSF